MVEWIIGFFLRFTLHKFQYNRTNNTLRYTIHHNKEYESVGFDQFLKPFHEESYIGLELESPQMPLGNQTKDSF